jgi:hypothetical protein
MLTRVRLGKQRLRGREVNVLTNLCQAKNYVATFREQEKFPILYPGGAEPGTTMYSCLNSSEPAMHGQPAEQQRRMIEWYSVYLQRHNEWRCPGQATVPATNSCSKIADKLGPTRPDSILIQKRQGVPQGTRSERRRELQENRQNLGGIGAKGEPGRTGGQMRKAKQKHVIVGSRPSTP